MRPARLIFRITPSSPYPPKTLPYKPFSFSVPRRNNKPDASQSASAKLFADATREEAELASAPRQPTRIPHLENQYENWNGEESVQDAVLRMLVDKYKPLRSRTIQTADQKMKQSPPQVHFENVTGSAASTTMANSAPYSGSWANEPLLPSSDSHRPWHTEFVVPSHATPSVRHAQFPPASSRTSNTPVSIDGRARKKQREAKKQMELTGRLTRAKESTLDYRLGIKGARGHGGRANPVSLKGWMSLIEDKIEVCI